MTQKQPTVVLFYARPPALATAYGRGESKLMIPFFSHCALDWVRGCAVPAMKKNLTHTPTPTPLHNTHSLQYYLA